MGSKLTGQERVLRALERRDHDRVPRYESFWPETITRWQNEGLNGDTRIVHQLLEADLHQICWTWPVAFPGRDEIVRLDKETRDIRDGQGKTLRYWREKSGTPEHLAFDCDTREKWEKIYKPALLSTHVQIDPEAARRNHFQGRELGRWTYIAGVESFEQTRSLLGDEIALMAMAEDPEWIVDVSRTYTDVSLRNFDAIMATGILPDGLWIYGDMAFKTATMCSPAMYRELIWPDHKRMADWAHAHRMKFIYHTDGDVNGVIDLYAAAGFDCLQPLECKAGMDIRRLCPKYGHQLSFFGNVDVMVMLTNDRERIEAEVRAKLAAGMGTKGYIYHSDHSVPPQVSWETYQFIIGLLNQYGAYP
jgi:uroporphyrinogen decarboxylase